MLYNCKISKRKSLIKQRDWICQGVSGESDLIYVFFHELLQLVFLVRNLAFLWREIIARDDSFLQDGAESAFFIFLVEVPYLIALSNVRQWFGELPVCWPFVYVERSVTRLVLDLLLLAEKKRPSLIFAFDLLSIERKLRRSEAFD